MYLVVVLFFIYSAVVVDFYQVATGYQLVSVRHSSGVYYLDALLALLTAVPVVSQYTTASGLSATYSFTAGAGDAFKQLLNTAASFLVVGAVFSFVTRHFAARKLIDGILKSPAVALEPDRRKRADLPQIDRLRWERFLRAAGILKSYVRAAYNRTTDDRQRVTLIAMATAKHSYSFPAHFIRSFERISDTVRADGTELIERFVVVRGPRRPRYAPGRVRGPLRRSALKAEFAWEMLADVCHAASELRHRNRELFAANELRLAKIVLACLYAMLQKSDTPNRERELRRLCRHAAMLAALRAILKSKEDELIITRVADVCVLARDQHILIDIMEAFDKMNSATQATVITFVEEMVERPGITFPPVTQSDPLTRLRDQVRALIKEPRPHAIRSRLQKLEDGIVQRREAVKGTGKKKGDIALTT